MASRKEYEMLFQLNAQLGSSYSSTFRSAEGSITSMQQEIAALTRTQADISAYEKQQIAVENSQKKLEVLQQQYDNIQKEMEETGTFSSALENKLLAKQQQIDKTSNSLEAQTNKLDYMGTSLKNAGVDTDNLSGETARLGNQIEDLKVKQVEAAEGASSFGSTASAAFSAVGQAVVAAGITVALKEISDWYGAAIEASMEYENVMASVRRTVGGTEEELATLSAQFIQLSTIAPLTTTEIGKIAETAGQLGIAQENVYEFTKVMAMLGTTTDLSADSAATMLAQFANITGLTDYERLGAVVADLGDATATTATKVVEMSQGMAAAASIAGLSETDILALAAATGSLGIESQAGSTALSTLISTLYKAVETGDKLEDFASIANMSASEFAVAWQDAPVKAMDAFIQGLNDTERNGKSAIVVLDDLGITNVRQTKAILGLASAGDLLSNTIVQANKAWDENTALNDKANVMYETTQSQLTMMENAYNALQVAIGDNFTPELRNMYGIGTDALNTIREFVEQNPELVKAITTFVSVIGLAAGGLAAYVAMTKLATIASAAFTAAIPGLNIVMGVVVGIAALTAGIVALTSASKKHTDESWELTAASREQYLKLQELNAEYDKAVEKYGETSYEAQSLSWQIEELTAEYEGGKQKITAYKEAHEQLVKSYVEMNAHHADAARELDKEQQSTLNLIAKLDELTSTSGDAAHNQQAILSVITALNKQMPELALNYDDVTQSSRGYIQSMYEIAEAQAAQAKLEAQWDEYIGRVGQQDALKSAKEAAELNARIAQEEYDLALQLYNEQANLYSHNFISQWFGTRSEVKELNAAQEQLELYNKVLEETTHLYGQNADAIADLEEAFNSYQRAQEEATVTGGNIREIIGGVTKEIRKLKEAYEEAYEAALESISGQYALWDEAAEVVAVSAGELNYAMETQTRYWQEYNTNLEALTGRTQEIEGLSDLLSTFADGSSNSVNAIAGLARATDSELKEMVEKWRALQTEHKTVAESLALLETDFVASMDALQAGLESTIGAMDLNEEAAESGKNTIEGFVRGAETMLPAVQAAYSKIAQAAIAAIDAQLEIHSPSKVFAKRGEFAMSGFVGGVEQMESDVVEAMKDMANVGLNSFAADEADPSSSLAAQFGKAIKAMWRGDPVVTASSGSGSNPIHVEISPHYEITGIDNTSDLENVLRQNDSRIRDLVLDILDDVMYGKERRAYV